MIETNLAALWNESAASYAALASRSTRFRRSSAACVAALKLRPNARVVDLGCGSGETSLALLKCLGEDGRVLAIDFAPAMLARTRYAVANDRRLEVATANILDGAELRAAVFAALPGPPHAVVANGLLPEIGSTAQFFQSLRAVLEPNATAALTIPASAFLEAPVPTESRGQTLLARLRARVLRAHGKPEDGARRPQGAFTMERLRLWAQALGMTLAVSAVVHVEARIDEVLAWYAVPVYRRSLSLPEAETRALLQAFTDELSESEAGTVVADVWLVVRLGVAP